MNCDKQKTTPLADALERMLTKEYVPFDVPGHKHNNQRLAEFFGERCVALDFNSRESIDNLCEPSGVIMEAQKLAAEAFGAEHAFFMVGGTTSSVQAMIMSTCSQGDKIILPRNVHVSVLNAVILSGAVPIYMNPKIHETLGISLGISPSEFEGCIKANTDAKAVFINNPTYYGICSDLSSIVQIAHEYGIKVLVDEAHGTHFAFSDNLPLSAMECGADMSAISMHKTGGSFTQSSILLIGKNVDCRHVQNVINLTRTTSSSYLLLASLDIARSNLACLGKEEQDRIISLVSNARKEINEIDGFYAFAEDIIDGEAVYNFDKTKLCINSSYIGLAGIELYKILRDEYRIQVEFGDINNILAICSIGDTKEKLDELIAAIRDISKKYESKNKLDYRYEYIAPTIKISPRKAYYMPRERLPLDKCLGRISHDFIMCYPPGIPILAPGELINEKIISHLKYATNKGCSVTGISDINNIYLNVVID